MWGAIEDGSSHKNVGVFRDRPICGNVGALIYGYIHRNVGCT